jgi:hypothetical protein
MIKVREIKMRFIIFFFIVIFCNSALASPITLHETCQDGPECIEMKSLDDHTTERAIKKPSLVLNEANIQKIEKIEFNYNLTPHLRFVLSRKTAEEFEKFTKSNRVV